MRSAMTSGMRRNFCYLKKIPYEHKFDLDCPSKSYVSDHVVRQSDFRDVCSRARYGGNLDHESGKPLAALSFTDVDCGISPLFLLHASGRRARGHGGSQKADDDH